MYTLEPNVISLLTETPIQIFGVKINYLVMIFTAWAVGYTWYRWAYFSNLRQAREIIRKFKLHLEAITPSEDLCSKVKDYFAEDISDTKPNDQLPNMQVLLQHSWQEFYEGTQVYPLGSNLLANTYQAEDFFTQRALISPFVQPLSHVSNFYTSSGLLFTFIALGAGMSSLIYTNPGMPIEGLKEFINALSGKFLTSIMGLMIALFVDSRIRSIEHSMEKDLSDILYQLNRRVRRLTSQNILTEMNASIKAIPENIETFLNKSYQDGGMMSQLKETIESSLKGVIETHVQDIRTDLAGISSNLKGFGEDGAAQLTEVMKTLGPELKEAIASGVSGDISQLNDTLGRLPTVIESSMTNIDRLQHSVNESQSLMLRSVRELLETVSNESKGSMEELLKILNENANSFQDRMLTYQEQQQLKNGESLEALTNMVDMLKQHQNDYSQQLDQNVSTALQKLDNSHAEAQERSNMAFIALQSSNKETEKAIKESITELEKFLNGQMRPFIEQAYELTNTQQKLNLENSTQFSRLQSLQGTLIESQERLENITNSLDRLQDDITQNTIATNGTLARNGEIVANCISKLNETREILDEEYSKLHDLAINIASVYAEAGDKMAQSIIKMQDDAQGFYGELGNETGKLTSELQSAISSLSGAVTHFEETLEDAKLSRV